MTWLEWAAGSVWQNAWVVLLVALTVGLAARAFSRPATRHALWSVVLLSFLLPLVWPVSPLAESLRVAQRARLLGGERVGAAAANESGSAVEQTAAPSAPDIEAREFVEAVTSGYSMPEVGAAGRPSGDAARELTGSPAAGAVEAREEARPAVREALGLVRDSGNARNTRVPVANSGADNDARRDERGTTDAFVTGTRRSRGPQLEPAVALYEPPRLSRAVGVAERSPDADLEQETQPGAAVQPGESEITPLGGQTPTAAGVDPVTTGPTISHSPAAGLFFAWLAAVLTFREALSMLPVMPPMVWAGGAALLALASLLRIVWFGRRLKRVGETPAWVQREAQEIAEQLGMRAAPRVVMVRRRISPLVWCVGEPRIFLPLELWKQLDRAGRRAILCHELAHLRRRDHWMCWVELMVTVLYWWHPVAWWVRHRLHEEADLSCDAWVTWVMPRRRRAYAEALLHTKQFIGPSTAQPVVGAAVTSANAKQLARRLTMVMTHQTRPRHSFVGLGMAATLVALAWAAAPAVSCPPEEKDKQRKADETTPTLLAIPVETVTIASGGHAPSGAANAAPPALFVAHGHAVGGQSAAASTVTTYAGGRAVGQGGLRSSAALRASGQPAFIAGAPTQGLTTAQSRGGRGAAGGRTPAPPGAPRSPNTFGGPGAFGAPSAPSAFGGPEGAQETRLYRLPEGKLKALTELMIRQDVPVLVRPTDDGIEVIGTAHQQEVFAAFVGLIHPEGRGPAPSAGFEGGGLYSPGATRPQIVAPVPPAQPRFPSGAVQSWPGGGASADARREMEEALRRTPNNARVRGMLEREMARREAAEALRRHADEARVQRDVRVRELQALSESLQQQSESLREQAERLREQVERMQEEMSSSEPDEQTQRTIRRQVRDMERQMRRIEKQVEEAQRRAEQSRAQAEELEHEGDEIDEEVDTLEESLRTLNDRLTDHMSVARPEAIPGAADLFAAHAPTVDEAASGFVSDALMSEITAMHGLAASSEAEVSHLIAQAMALSERVSGERAGQLASRLGELAARLAARAEAGQSGSGCAGGDEDEDGDADEDEDEDQESAPSPVTPGAAR